MPIRIADYSCGYCGADLFNQPGRCADVTGCRARIRIRIAESVAGLSLNLADLMPADLRHTTHSCTFPGEHSVHVCDCGSVWTSAPYSHGVIDRMWADVSAAIDEWAGLRSPEAPDANPGALQPGEGDTPQPLTAALAGGPVALVDTALQTLSKLRVWAVMSTLDTPVSRPAIAPAPPPSDPVHTGMPPLDGRPPADPKLYANPEDRAVGEAAAINDVMALALIRVRRLAHPEPGVAHCVRCGHAPARNEELHRPAVTPALQAADVCVDASKCRVRTVINREASDQL